MALRKSSAAGCYLFFFSNDFLFKQTWWRRWWCLGGKGLVGAYKKVCKNAGEEERWDSVPAWSPFPPLLFNNTDVLQTNKGEFRFWESRLTKIIILWKYFHRFSSSDYWFNQMYYGTHGPFKRAEGGQAITFENDKVQNFIPSSCENY